MFILFGYLSNIYKPTPDIRIYGCFDSLDKCVDRIRSITLSHIDPPKYHDRPNVLRSGKYIFWYKNFENFELMNIQTNNIDS
jgi:hypothetical protein